MKNVSFKIGEKVNFIFECKIKMGTIESVSTNNNETMIVVKGEDKVKYELPVSRIAKLSKEEVKTDPQVVINESEFEELCKRITIEQCQRLGLYGGVLVQPIALVFTKIRKALFENNEK